MAVTFDWRGSNALAPIREAVVGRLDRLGRRVVELARKYAPVETGFLRDAIGFTVRAVGSVLSLVVHCDAPYAAIQEYGGVHTPAHPFLRPAVAEACAEFGMPPFGVALGLPGGTPVRRPTTLGRVDDGRLEDEEGTLVTTIFVNRGRLINGLFYGLDGMRVGGMRRLEIAPHLGYGERGVADVIPPNSALIVEVTVLAAVP